MESIWDQRCRFYYKAHYEARRSQMDWDYWMKLCKKSDTNGCIHKNIIDYHEFMNWRMTGNAFSLHECPKAPNRTLLAETKTIKNE